MSKPRIAGLSDPGPHHDDNQDRWLVDDDLGLALVSDGMAEAVTPQFVIETFPDMLRAARPCDGIWQAERVVELVAELNRRVEAEANSRGPVTGATLLFLLWKGSSPFLVHLGDSRAYRCRGARLERLTVDHSILQKLIDDGVVSQEEAARARGNGGPTRFLGMPGEADAEVQALDWQPGDRVLLCSDGLTDMLTDMEIRPLLANAQNPDEACQSLVDAALRAGGYDNVTTLVLFAGEPS